MYAIRSYYESEEVAALKYKEPEVDLAAISDESLALIKTAMVATGLVGLYLIWSSVFPALRVFEDVDLWHYTVTVKGEEQQPQRILDKYPERLLEMAVKGMLPKNKLGRALFKNLHVVVGRITSYNVCYTKLLRQGQFLLVSVCYCQ